MYLNLQPEVARTLPRRTAIITITASLGFISSLVRIGGRSMTVALQTVCDLVFYTMIVTSTASGFPIAVAGTLGFMVLLPATTELPKYSIGFVY